MEESPCRQFRGDKHRGMLIQGQGTILQIRELTGMRLQVKKGWLSVKTIKRNVILLDSAPNQNGPRIQHGLRKRSAFQTDDLDAFDSDCDDAPLAKAVLMANLSSYDSNVISEVQFHDTNIENDMSYDAVVGNRLGRLDHDLTEF
ncbi:hypothetical protein Tco_0482152 [Tanacetum coccineum]